MLPGNGNDERQLKMADSSSSSTDDWEGFFQSLVDLLNDCEKSSVSTSVTRETVTLTLTSFAQEKNSHQGCVK